MRCASGTTIERIGFIWLLATGLLLLGRCLIDSTMVRRPLLEPNMTTGGLIFSCCSLFVFLMANIVVSRPTADDLLGPASAEHLISRQATDDLDRHGPGYALVFMLPSLPTVKMGSSLARQRVDAPSARVRGWKYRPADGSTVRRCGGGVPGDRFGRADPPPETGWHGTGDRLPGI